MASQLSTVKTWQAALMVLSVILGVSRSVVVAGDRASEYLDLRRLVGNEDFGHAISRCEHLVETYPDYLYLYETLPEVCLYTGELNRAVSYFEKRIDEGYQLGLSYYGLGMAYYYEKDFKTAVLAFNKAIELGLTAPECYRSLEYAYERVEDPEGSIRLFQSLCHHNPENAGYWYGLALSYWAKHDYGKVLASLDEALARRPGDSKFLQLKAAAWSIRGRGEIAIKLINELLPLARENEDLNGIQFLRSHLIYVFFQTNQLSNATATTGELLADSKTYGLIRWVGWGYEQLADIDFRMGNYPNALFFARKALSTVERTADVDLKHAALVRLFDTDMELGNFEEALDCANQRLKSLQSQDDKRGCVQVLSEIARTYHEIGAEDIAMDYAIEALTSGEIYSSDPKLLFSIQTNLGLIYSGVGKNREALSHHKAAQSLIPEDDDTERFRAINDGNLGDALAGLGDWTNAKTRFDSQLLVARQVGFDREESYALANLGRYYLRLRHYEVARCYFLQGLRRSDRLGQRPTLLVCLRGLAELAGREGKNEESLAWYRKAIEISESMNSIHRTPFAITSTVRSASSDYQNSVRILCSLGRIDSAFTMADRAKVRSNVSQIRYLQERMVDLLSDSLRLRVLQIRSDLEKNRLQLVLNYTDQWPGKSGEKRLKILHDVADLEIEYRHILDSAHLSDRLSVNREEEATAGIGGFRRVMLFSDQALIQYVVGESQTEAFCVRRDTLLHFTVRKGREELCALAQKMSLVLGNRPNGAVVWNAQLANFDVEACTELCDLLVRPAEKLLRDVNRIVFVPDDVLNGIPFEALVWDPQGGSRRRAFGGVKFLLELFEISYAPAAVFLDCRIKGQNAPRKTLLAVGNPLIPPPGASPGKEFDLHFRKRWAPAHSPILPGAQAEVEDIGAMFMGQCDLLIGAKATKSSFQKLAPQYRIVHIAAHASFDPEWPMNSFISMTPDETSSEGGEFRAYEFFTLNLGAELFVLSACNTGGYRVTGGLEGIVRALVLSGVPSVISSLWSVDDESTARMMKNFYSYLKKGERKSRALQLAKLDLIKSGVTDPFYWAAFVLVGDTSPVGFTPISDAPPGKWLAALLLGLPFFLVAASLLTMRLRCRRR